MKRIGILGGSFSPIHNGHLQIAQDCLIEMGLDKILFLPNSNPPHKANDKYPFDIRVAMLKLAIEDNDKFDISFVEKDSTKIHFSYNTIRDNFYNTEDKYYFIMGDDEFLNIKSWKKSIRYLVPEKVSRYIYEELNYFDIEKIKKDLKEKLSENRYEHSLRVADYCKRLAKIYNADENKAYLSGLVHDCAKNLEEYYMLNSKVNSDIIFDTEEKNNPKIQHGPIGSIVCKNIYGIVDDEILSGVRYHTTAKENMSMIEKILFISDKIEPNRKYDTVEELRKLADYNIDKAIIKFLNDSFNYLEKKSERIHPLSIRARDYLVNMR